VDEVGALGVRHSRENRGLCRPADLL
jgi:hypothetical protein